MRCEQLTLENPAKTAAVLRASVPDAKQVSQTVTEVIGRVRAEGDGAVAAYTRTLDTCGREPLPLRVSPEELEHAATKLVPQVRDGLGLAIANVRRVAEGAVALEQTVEFPHHTVSIREAPVAAAAIYVPGGRAPYPSTVVMGVVTAKVAGVPRVVVSSPPGRDREIDGAVLATSLLAGADTVYRMGGAQAIAALAYGTSTVGTVDVIVGPGNLYVQEAKRQVSDRVGIDGFAGPSDLVVLAGEDADPQLTALDLLAQAEHGPGTLVVAISDSRDLLARVHDRLRAAPDTGAVAALVEASRADDALAAARELAPEHLQLVGAHFEPLAPRVTWAGAVFVGAAGGTAFGDYIAGSNHILPTAGTARFASSLSPASFRRRFYEVRVTEPAPLARLAAPLARAEGFELHARSMEARIRDNPPSP